MLTIPPSAHFGWGPQWMWGRGGSSQSGITASRHQHQFLYSSRLFHHLLLPGWGTWMDGRMTKGTTGRDGWKGGPPADRRTPRILLCWRFKAPRFSNAGKQNARTIKISDFFSIFPCFPMCFQGEKARHNYHKGPVPHVKRKRIPHYITISFTLIRECRPLGINGTVPYPFPLTFWWGRKS